MIFVSATPAKYELAHSTDAIVEQVVRPDRISSIPRSRCAAVRTQVDDVLSEIRLTVAQQERVLVTTLTKRMSEDLTGVLAGAWREGALPALRYRDRRADARSSGTCARASSTCWWAINLLREGLDLPEVSLVAILDADKEGFLRSEGSLIQTIGRAARNVHGRAILYADSITGSMKRAMDETSRRRDKQIAYNTEHGITPRSIKKAVQDVMEGARSAEERGGIDLPLGAMKPAEIQKKIKKLEAEMMKLARNLEFEQAARVRDEIGRLREAEAGTTRLIPQVRAAPSARTLGVSTLTAGERRLSCPRSSVLRRHPLSADLVTTPIIGVARGIQCEVHRSWIACRGGCDRLHLHVGVITGARRNRCRWCIAAVLIAVEGQVVAQEVAHRAIRVERDRADVRQEGWRWVEGAEGSVRLRIDVHRPGSLQVGDGAGPSVVTVPFGTGVITGAAGTGVKETPKRPLASTYTGATPDAFVRSVIVMEGK
jgi:hypothetical protein